MKLRFSLRTTLIAITLVCIALFTYFNFPRWQVAGAPNLIGTVIDSEGNPLADATVVVNYFRQATTDKRGKFRIESVNLSDVPLDPGSKGFWNWNSPAERTADPFADEFPDEFVFFKVTHKTHYYADWFEEPKKTNHVNMVKDIDHVFELEMKLGGVVSGRLTDESGEPVIETEVKFICKNKPDFVRWCTTDFNGCFKTCALPPQGFDVGIDYSQAMKLKLIGDYDSRIFRKAPDDPAYFCFMKFGEVRLTTGQKIEFDCEISMENWIKFEDNVRPLDNDPDDFAAGALRPAAPTDELLRSNSGKLRKLHQRDMRIK